MLKYILFLLLLVSATACSNDIDRNITTDLQVEGKEIFNVSLALEEPLYYAFLTLDQYRTAKNDTLKSNDSLPKVPIVPGCPLIGIDETLKLVTLTFSKQVDCSSQKLKRVGKITLQFLSPNVLESNVLMVYDQYSIGTTKIEGTRVFKQTRGVFPQSRRTELFEDMLIIDEFGSSTKISGSFGHQLSFQNGTLLEYKTSGNLEGRNLTGRKIKMTQTNPRIYKTNCVKQGIVLASEGLENWEIFRTPTQSLRHNLEYQQEGACEPKAVIALSDGRTLVFRQEGTELGK
ncbi:hypothetical protein P872_25155 [Rhodonellum psychrophilum GCM71 = DSM 17998]|uniref:Lipoprotein n=2 Tax=Rhodonellum TaxID=336827 RepID=U5C8D5_9BACT|nr:MULTISPECIES: hypothetical protein [Rhodonellum]ERM84447.1 hypothetical protein P872_25155 [Rhodonellum psychrophilum GCM71 = DSM 17998]SDZ00371.1 hypothetical protein SAMN05444412_104263 [Rhodonellum ikkaensis]